MTASVNRFVELLVGPPGRGRGGASLSLLGLCIYAVFALVQHGEVMLGLIDAASSHALTLFNLTGATIFYVLVRSGASVHLSSDPALTRPQMAFGVLATTGSYLITGPARGAVMAITMLILVHGMFALAPRQARQMALFGVALLGLAMAVRTVLTPETYPWRVELIHFVFALVVLGGMHALSARVGRMRARLQEQRAELTLQKAELEAALERNRLLATQDELTGLFNRRHMGSLLLAERSRHQRAGGAMSVVLIDLDWFKRINDTHGHPAGDIVLKRFAQAGRATLRASDVLARWGGEEFLMMLPETTPAQALQCVDRLREALSRMPFDDIAPGLTVSFSAGIALCEPPRSLDEALEAADHALYRAKTAGRARSELESRDETAAA